MSFLNPTLQLDFRAKRPVWSWLGLLLLALAVCLVVWVFQQQYKLQLAHDEIDQAISQLAEQNQARQQPVVKTDDTATRADTLQAQWITDQLAFPWEPLFQTLEKVQQPDVALLSLQPDTKKMQVKLGGEAKDFNTVLTYIDQLQASPVFSKIYLIKHEVNESIQQKPIDFTLIAYWQNSHE
ncbi:MAG TPA: PilN domain-containing protein [Methylophilaceae bacterium]|jgi:Tfp pilus assembly protein PilN